MSAPSATVVYVAYNTPSLDLSWIPEDAPVIVVHNDRSLDPATLRSTGVTHLFSETNIGFGAGVNLALEHVATDRTILVNPDTVLTAEHFDALATGEADEVRVIPLVQPDGTPTSVVNRYPTPASLLLTFLNAGRWLRRGSVLRRATTHLLGRWGRTHELLQTATAGRWGLGQHWVSGAVFSVDTERLRDVGGFDESYFLYFEDVDLCSRLAARGSSMRVRMMDARAAVHEVGGAGGRGRSGEVDDHYRASARQWAARQHGPGWRLVARVVGATRTP